MMKAFAVEHWETGPLLRDMPAPEPAAREVLVRVTVAGVNPIDWKVLDRKAGSLPLVVGQDFAGVVAGLGSEVGRYVIDDRIFGIARSHGAYATYTVVPEDSHDEPTAKIPEGVGDADAAALPTAGLTALAAMEMLGIKVGSTILITGALGGVGGLASQMAHARGATVIGTMHSGKEEYARSLGVDEPIAYDRDDVVASVKRRHPDGVDALLDLVDNAEDMKRLGAALRAGGKAASVIGAADVEWFKTRGLEAKNLVMSQTPQSSHEGLRELAKMLEDGTLRLVIAAEHDLRDAARALEASRSAHADGKILITTE